MGKKGAVPFFLFLLVFAIGVTLRITNLNNVARRSPDERTYTYLAKTILEKGTVKGVKLLIEEHSSNQELWIYFPPITTRTGYLSLLAAIMKIASSVDIKIGSYISCAFSIVSLLLLIAIGLRFFNPWIALCALLFMSVSPMELAIARRTWQDAMVGCLGLSLIYFSCEISRNTNKIFWYIPFIILGSYFISVKESGIVIYGLCIIWLLWMLSRKENFLSKSILLITSCSLGLAVAVAILIYISGGIQPAIQTFNIWKAAIPTNTYALEYQSGPWYYFLQGFWIISPFNAFMCLIGMAGTLLSVKALREMPPLSDQAKRRSILGIIFVAAAFMIIGLATPHFQNLRYVSALYGPFYLVSALGLWYIISLAGVFKSKGFYSYIVVIGIIIAVGFAAARDYHNFKKIFIRNGILDLSIRMVRECSRF